MHLDDSCPTASTARLLTRKRLAQQETMRTYLFAALVGLCANGAVAQDDNAITDMISNPILCVSAAHESSFMRFTTPSERPLWLLDGAHENWFR